MGFPVLTFGTDTSIHMALRHTLTLAQSHPLHRRYRESRLIYDQLVSPKIIVRHAPPDAIPQITDAWVNCQTDSL